MFGKFSIALLIVASPALAQEAPPVAQPDGATVAEAPAPKITYKTKKVCRSIEVVGSSIPKTTCTTKKIPIKPVETQEADAQDAPQSEAQE